jgi:hypothetical protein
VCITSDNFTIRVDSVRLSVLVKPSDVTLQEDSDYWVARIMDIRSTDSEQPDVSLHIILDEKEY